MHFLKCERKDCQGQMSGWCHSPQAEKASGVAGVGGPRFCEEGLL